MHNLVEILVTNMILSLDIKMLSKPLTTKEDMVMRAS